MSNLTETERGQIIGLHIGGNSKVKISKILGFSRTTVTRTIKNYEIRGSVKDLTRSGRPKILNNDHQKVLKAIVKQNNTESAEIIKKEFNQKTGLQVSINTLRRSLHDIGIFSCVPARKPLINEGHRQKRMGWCLRRKDWSVKKWKNVIWSDESRFTLFRNDGPGRVWRTLGTRFDIENLRPTVKHGGGSVMFWGCFSGKGLGPLVKVDGKMNQHDYIEILQSYLLPLINNSFNNRGYLFQDDNAPVHTAKKVKEWIKTNEIKILESWPSQSPDLNPIEHLWSELETRIRKKPKPARNLNELEATIIEEWNKIPNNVYLKLIESMPRRIAECIANNGWPTSY